MITVKLLGGLGNQMFQRAFGIALEARGYEVEYNKTALIPGTHREYSLDGFRGTVKLNERAFPNNIYEDGMRFNPAMLSPEDGGMMVGYWQTERYFEGVEEQVRNAFVPRAPFSDYAYSILQDIKRGDSLSLHVRRQDYVGLEHFHGMPTLEWYKNAVEFMHIYNKSPRVFVFSDDPEWCKEKFLGSTIVQGTNKFEDLQLMSWCKHAILANSSFSWWGAWLRENPGMTVAPKEWFADPKVDFSDIVPKRWVRL